MDTVVLLSILTGLAAGALAAWVVARSQFRRDLAESIATHQATIGAAQAPNSITLPIERQVRYRVQDFTFLGNVIEDPCGLWVKADSPITSVADLVAAAKARPGQVTIGTAGVGSDDHFLVAPDDVTWGHVGTLEDYAALLQRITDVAFHEGGHAD